MGSLVLFEGRFGVRTRLSCRSFEAPTTPAQESARGSSPIVAVQVQLRAALAGRRKECHRMQPTILHLSTAFEIG
ncbi:MAG: hypothetical protein CL910_14480, partial [Deltaproteobacteria bacterium]|nr:hypothetical protein [Deltaproteobacteria bacterium]